MTETNQKSSEGSVTCLSAACSCTVEGDSSYCCDACRALYIDSPTSRGPCPCGHDGCA